MATRFFAYRFNGRRQIPGPASGLIYIFENGVVTPVADERDADIFLLMGSPESGFYLFREVDVFGQPVGAFPPVNPQLRQGMIDPKKFPTDKIPVTLAEWRLITETLADPVLFFYYSRVKLR